MQHFNSIVGVTSVIARRSGATTKQSPLTRRLSITGRFAASGFRRRLLILATNLALEKAVGIIKDCSFTALMIFILINETDVL